MTDKRKMTEVERAMVRLSDTILHRVAHDRQAPANPDVLLAAIHVHRVELECLRAVLFGDAFGAGERPTREQMLRAFDALFIKRCEEEATRYALPAILRVNGGG